MKIKDIIADLEEFAPTQLQENYDNSGLNIGNPNEQVKGVLLTIDVTKEVIEEAIKNKCNLIISHHPLIFGKLKQITGANYIEQCIITAIKNDISIYCAHTNFDSVSNGVSHKICEKLELNNLQTLSPKSDFLLKLVVFVPDSYSEKVRQSIIKAGAGNIGNYDSCSFSSKGTGSYKAGEKATPFVGEKGKIHFENEVRLETVFPKHLKNKIINSMLDAHPYEEVAYDLYKLENRWNSAGLGMLGELENAISEENLMDLIKKTFDISVIKHSPLLNKKVKKIAVCGGSGASLIPTAMSSKADVYITGDIKYHDYFLSEDKILLIDIGHYESEQFTKEIFYDIIMKKNPNFAVRFSKIITNPIKNY